MKRLTNKENIEKLRSNYAGLLKFNADNYDWLTEVKMKLSDYEDLNYSPKQLKILIEALSMKKEEAVEHLKQNFCDKDFDGKYNWGVVVLIAWLEEYICLKEMFKR